MKRALLWVVLAGASSSLACKPRIGDPCREANEECKDEHTKLVCKNGRFMPIPCDGDKGCSLDRTMGKARCDWSGNKQGSHCDDRLSGMRMCRDTKSSLACRSGQFDLLRCRGPKGCQPEGSESDSIAKTCDNSIAKAGDTCDPVWSPAPACDDEGKSELFCQKSGVFAFKRHCRGPKGCVVKEGAAWCDDSLQEVGDPCVSLPELCSEDGRAMLVCGLGTVIERPCPGPSGCAHTEAGGVSCDTGFAYEGAPCEKQGRLGCTVADPWHEAKLLECNGSAFAVSKPCPGGCTFTPPNTFECSEKEAPKKKK
jgi:hypothetical protein